MAVVDIEAQKKPSISIRSQCLGNVMRVNVGPLGGKLLEVAVVINNSAIILTPSLASQCGFSMKIDQLGNAVIYASLQNCFAQNVEDKAFTTTLNLRLHGNQMVEDELYQVAETCQYTTWASREIVCDRSYMEASKCSGTLMGHVTVSVKRAAPDDYGLPEHPILGANSKFGDPRRAAEKQSIDAGFRITTLIFYTPGEKLMNVVEAQRNGYGITNTATRLVLRSPKTSPETYIQNVAAVPMTVLTTSVIFEKKWLATQIDAAIACPTLEGSVSFTLNTITWFLPRHIDPLIHSGQFKLLEVHMGIDGQRLEPAEIAARRYSLTVNDVYIIVEIPIGAVGGYFKSHVQDGQYLTSYTIEPMLELLWTEDSINEDTRYKVLLPITAPLMSRPPQVHDNTVKEERIFKVLLGPLGSDVALMDITFPTEVLTVADCNARGFNVQEHMSPDSNSKVFTLQVPFTDRAVLQTKEMGMTLYSLQMTFGLLVLPEFAPFSHPAYLEASLVDIVPPSVSGGCDYQNFYALVKYGTGGSNFQIMLGKRMLTPDLAQQYGLTENGTHLSVTVPFSSPDVVYEAVESSFIRSRLDVGLINPETNINFKEFSVACNFFSTLTECFPNGTMTALAVKLESVPSLNPSQLTLRDPTCGPSYSDDRYAYFVFSGNSCGTTRKFLPNMMLYENEISLPDELEMQKESTTNEPEYELKVSCHYDINKTHAVAFHARPRRSEPYAENARGELQVAIRLATDNSYSMFHSTEDYPIARYLQQPLYFEVQLMKSANPELSLELENCWATLDDDRTSQPRWNLIINGCANPVDPNQVIFHPVWADARVQYPPHFKRFEVLMFAFAEDQDNLSSQLFVHCDVVICDAKNPLGGACNRQCSNQENRIKGMTESSGCWKK
ncbi:Zona pellucida sperm-binding protein 2 [Nibea albiflora]|uniref:Zona pellucida sperm-binding protein 2 n=1 Tax=Nibea albiflora TaxID=240163 RepID=A0ACB7FAE9_NIBAL|nr:Zona pellucida sperm-binding protein 2 [Nibea albiflora]